MTTVPSSVTAVWSAFLWVWALAKAHPAISTPILGALLTVVFKPRTGDQYARLAARNPVWLFTRVAAMLQLVAALFPDPVKAQAIVIKVFTGKQDVEKLPPAISPANALPLTPSSPPTQKGTPPS